MAHSSKFKKAVEKQIQQYSGLLYGVASPSGHKPKRRLADVRLKSGCETLLLNGEGDDGVASSAQRWSSYTNRSVSFLSYATQKLPLAGIFGPLTLQDF
jgi:hypothetical protein